MMHKIVLLLVLVFSVAMVWAENYASNARAEQVERTMVITYDLSKTANVRLLVATNMSNDFQEVKKVTGAVGKNVQAGANRQITWNVLEEYDRFVADGVRFKVETYGAEGIGVFSISSSKKVTFSPGNLQYTQSTNTWSFASAQWEMIGTDNVTGGSVASDPTYGDRKEGTALADKVDFFGWSGASTTHFGVSTFTDYNDYSGSFVDWGTNKIGNDAPNTWRTLTYNEWEYILNTRPNASSLEGVAQVNGVNGLILLPDEWVCSSDVTFKSGFHSKSEVPYYAYYQTFTLEQWSKMEKAGAVFLPAAGCRERSNVYLVQYGGFYWSATEYGSYRASPLGFSSDGAVMYGSRRRDYGLSVRLVKDL